MGALVWPAALGVITAWLLPAMSYYGSLAAAAGGGALIALLLGSRRPVWSVVALTVGAIPGTVLLVQGGRALLGVLGIANGAAPVFFFVLAGLLVLPLVKLVLPTGSTISSAKSIMRQRGFLVPMGALALTVTLASIGIAVDRFDQTHPRQSHLMYVIDADSGTACGSAMIKNLTLGRRRTSRTATTAPSRMCHFLTTRRRDGKAPPLRCPSSRHGSLYWNPGAPLTAPSSRYGSHSSRYGSHPRGRLM
jgi:hypothetical protein